MNAKAMSLGGSVLLVGALLLWSCAADNTGSLDSPCSSSGDCGSGLICAVGRCSNRSKGSFCDKNDQCIEGLICNGVKCGGTDGDQCLQGDMDCIPGLICAGVPGDRLCTPRGDGMVGSQCGNSGHCNENLQCSNGLCNILGSLGSACVDENDRDDDSLCNSPLVCINSICNNKSGEGGVCSNDDHCLDFLSLMCDDGRCRRSMGTGCSADGNCQSGFICAGRPPVCVMPNGSVCGINSHCTGGLLCVLGACSEGNAGSRCLTSDDCTGSLICVNSMCGLDVESMCSTDEACAGSLICAGPTVDALTCAQSNGLLGNACRISDHCVGDLVCSSSGESSECRVARGDVCVADGDCVNTDDDSNVCQFGQNAQPRVCTPLDPRIGGVCRNDDQCAGDNVICIDDPGRQICAEKGDGSIGSVCNRDEHCDIEDGMGGMDETPICHNYACAAVGTKWTSRVSNVSGELVDVHYGGNRWVAAGGIAVRGDITTSRDGTVWTSEITSETHRINAIHYASDRWIAVSIGGNLISSTDNGMSWGMPRTPTSESTALTAIHYNFAKWVVVGENTNGGGYIATSSNGINWTSRPSNVSSGLNATYRSDMNTSSDAWVAVGDRGVISTSAPQASPPLSAGNVWASQTSGVSSGLVDVYYGNGLWVAASGDGNIITSSNGTTWVAQRLTDSGIRDIHYANSLWVAVGNDTGDSSVFIATSGNGTTWSELTSENDGNVSGTLNAVHYDNDLWVAVGNGGVIVTSTNGTTWTEVEESNVTSDLTDIHYANSRWVAVGADGTITTSRTRLNN